MEVHFNTLNVTAQLELDHVMPQGIHTIAITVNIHFKGIQVVFLFCFYLPNHTQNVISGRKNYN